MENLVRFYAASDLIANISRTSHDNQNRSYVTENGSFRVQPKMFGELWSTNKKVAHANLDPPKWTFSED